jgi:hypothetical protein
MGRSIIGWANPSKFTTDKGVKMCSKVTCEICKKATWSGCGEHIEEALEGVAEADRCSCLK